MNDTELLTQSFENLESFNSFEDIRTAIYLDIPVYWSNKGYQVVKDGYGQLLVKFLGNNSCVGLHEPSYNPKDFFSGVKAL